MVISQALFDDLTALADASSRLQMNLDLRDYLVGFSQQMLSAIQPGGASLSPVSA